MAREAGKTYSTRIKISNGYEIVVDSTNYMLVFNTGTKDKDGNDNIKYLSYHGSLDKALLAFRNEIVRKNLIDAQVDNIDDAVSVIVRANNHYASLIQNAFEGVAV